jgi:hypothetical protein
MVTETTINAKIENNKFDSFINAGLGLLMLGDTSRIYYGSVAGTPNANPSATYWNDSPEITHNLFQNSVAGSVAGIIDAGSQSEMVRTISNNIFYTAALADMQYGYVARNVTPSITGANWFENVRYPIRTLNSNASEGGSSTALTGVTASQPSGTYTLARFPDGYGYGMTVMGAYFAFGINDINCNGINGSCIIGGNISQGMTGYHVGAFQSGAQRVIDLGDQIVGASGVYKSITVISAYVGLGVNGGYVPYFGTPASSSAACDKGQVAFDAAYVYTCTATNTWRRAATSSF